MWLTWLRLTRGRIVLVSALAFAAVGCRERDRAAHVARVFPLAPDEGVFAYARISPDGTHLAYTSEAPPQEPGGPPRRTVRIVDLDGPRVVFEQRGIDAYWSPDGRRLIFLEEKNDLSTSVCILHMDTGVLSCDVAPPIFGDYFSWGVRDGRDLIATINSYYYFLDGNHAVLPPARVTSCPDIGVGSRPLVSRDGTGITTFVSGTIVVRNLTDCDRIVRTNLRGGKADFSADGRYIAFHSLKADGKGYEIKVVDIVRKRVSSVIGLPGSSLFPNWTADGRLSFRYDSEEFRGFVIASDFQGNTSQPLPAKPTPNDPRVSWHDLFPDAPAPSHQIQLVLIWAPWNAHSPDALLDLQTASDWWQTHGVNIGVFAAPEPTSFRTDIDRMKTETAIRVPEIELPGDRVEMAGAHNHIPTVLLFEGDVLIDRRLGAQSPEALVEWIRHVLADVNALAAK